MSRSYLCYLLFSSPGNADLDEKSAPQRNASTRRIGRLIFIQALWQSWILLTISCPMTQGITRASFLHGQMNVRAQHFFAQLRNLLRPQLYTPDSRGQMLPSITHPYSQKSSPVLYSSMQAWVRMMSTLNFPLYHRPLSMYLIHKAPKKSQFWVCFGGNRRVPFEGGRYSTCDARTTPHWGGKVGYSIIKMSWT